MRDRCGWMRDRVRDRLRLSATPGGGCATGLGVVLGMLDDNHAPRGDPVGWEITD